MPDRRSSFLSRASGAFSSLAVSCSLAILTLLALTVGALQDSHADGVSGGVVNASVPNVAIPLADAAPIAAPRQSFSARDAVSLHWISRRGATSRSKESPVRELFGLSKIVFPLLVSDMVPVDASGMTVVTSGSAVGAR